MCSVCLKRRSTDSLGIVSVEPTRTARRKRVENEVLVVYEMVEDRDLVQSYAEEEGKKFRDVHATGVQAVFNHVVQRASSNEACVLMLSLIHI